METLAGNHSASRSLGSSSQSAWQVSGNQCTQWIPVWTVYPIKKINIYIFSKHRPSGPMLSISLIVRLSVRLSVHVFTFEVPLKRLFSPTSRSRISNIFRDLESLVKSNGKKWSQMWTFLFESGLKLLKNKFFLADLALQNKVETTFTDGLGTSDRRAYH